MDQRRLGPLEIICYSPAEPEIGILVDGLRHEAPATSRQRGVQRQDVHDMICSDAGLMGVDDQACILGPGVMGKPPSSAPRNQFSQVRLPQSTGEFVAWTILKPCVCQIRTLPCPTQSARLVPGSRGKQWQRPETPAQQRRPPCRCCHSR